MPKNLLRALADYRLKAALTFRELSAQMTAAGYPVEAQALHHVLTDRLLTQPRATTLYKIERFLAIPEPKRPLVVLPTPKARKRKARRRVAA